MSDDIKQMLSEILSSVKGLEGRVAKLETGSVQDAIVSVQQNTQKKMSIKEFLIEKSPANAVQTTLAIAYYLETYDGVSPINAADLEKGFRAAKETVPTNINDKTNMCVANGYLMEEKEKKNRMKAWVVTRSGEQIVQTGFSKKNSR